MNEEKKKGLLPGDVLVEKDGVSYVAYTLVQKGGVLLRFSEVSFTRQSVECVLQIDPMIEGENLPSFSQRVDLRSASAQKSLATELNSAYGDKKSGFNWVLILNNVFTRLIAEIKKGQKPIDLSGGTYVELPFLVYPFLQENVPNMLFAQPEAGKSIFALRMAASLAMAEPFLSYQIKERRRTLYIDYEDDVKTLINRLHMVARGMNSEYEELAKYIQYFKPTGSLRNNVELVKQLVVEGKFDLIIIDAGGDATGGSPSDEEKVLDMFNALDEIPCTKLILHHEPKNVLNEAAAFYGSMYWKARARVAWRLKVESDSKEEKIIKASIEKRSNLPFIEPFFYKMKFETISLDEMFGEPTRPLVPAVTLELAQEVKGDSLPNQILFLLGQYEELTIKQMAEFTGKDQSGIGKVLRGQIKDSVNQIKSGNSVKWKLNHVNGRTHTENSASTDPTEF